jgi:hypothetical protein
VSHFVVRRESVIKFVTRSWGLHEEANCTTTQFRVALVQFLLYLRAVLMTPHPSCRVRFGAFELDPRSGELRSIEATDPNSKVLLREQVFQLSLMLVEDPLARLQLGRAERLMGDNESARKSYEEFLNIWKDADPDLPTYQQAKAEYAQLKRSRYPNSR